VGGVISFKKLGLIQRFPEPWQPQIKLLHRRVGGARRGCSRRQQAAPTQRLPPSCNAGAAQQALAALRESQRLPRCPAVA
jgi:hypothetical protein